jgi:hypothetical protein
MNARLARLFLRRMTVSLITPSVYAGMRALASASLKVRESFLSGLPQVLLGLPAPHRMLLWHTLGVLRRVTDCEDVNRMSSDAVARIFAAGVLPASALLDAQTTMADIQEANDVRAER